MPKAQKRNDLNNTNQAFFEENAALLQQKISDTALVCISTMS